ncbi:MAG: DUF4199 domain-containing protein [Bacteroidales bacterium]|jgi:hypothetical protein|nr:DUF4199 domain-containing protein [Bacteroidales bacterium]
MQEVMINKTVLAMRLGLILAFSYVMRDLLSFNAGDGILSIVSMFVSIFFLVFPFVFLFRMTVNFCCRYNDCKYQFSTPFSIAVKGFAFAGIIYSLCFYLYMKNFAPNLMSDVVNSYEKVLEGQGYDNLIAQWKEVSASATPKSMIPSIYIGFFFMGLFVSLISVGAARFASMEKPVDDNFTSSGRNDSQYDKNESKDNSKDN